MCKSLKNRERRKVLKNLSLGASSVLMAPYVWTQEKPVLRVLGAYLHEDVRLKAEEDLGFRIEFTFGEHSDVTHKAATQPESFDIFEKTADYIDILWNSGAIQPIEKNRIREWPAVSSLAKTGRVKTGTQIGLGDAPYKELNVLPGNILGETPTNQISFLPYMHNVDGFGYLTGSTADRSGEETESWSWLLDDRNHGKVGILIDPAVGFNELALAARASGKVSIKDLGNMTRSEIDDMVKILVDLKRAGHFAGFWSTLPKSVEFIKTGRTQIQSMFSPAFYHLKSKGVEISYAVPKEGYRAWQGALCLSSKTNPTAKDMAYEYMNWYLSGWPGAYISRQGYYTSNPDSARAYLSTSEWDYWYEGKPAETDLPGIDGETAVRKGETRPGGSYTNRLSSIAVWNGITTDYEYKLSGWYDFLTA